MNKNKIYADKYFSAELGEENIDKMINLIKIANGGYDNSEKAIEILKSNFNKIKMQFNLNCVVGFICFENKEVIHLALFESVESNDNIYTLNYDEEKEKHYIEI